MGAFDDLIPKAAAQQAGAFDDLIPGAKAAPRERVDVPDMTVGSVAQDILSGALQIGPTAVKGVADIARLATGDRVGRDTSEAMKRGMESIQEEIGSNRAAAQRANFQVDMQDESVGIGETLMRNKGALADQLLPTIGSMFLPVGVASAAGKVATVGQRSADAAQVAARVARAQQAAGVSTVAAQNAAGTFVELLDKGVPMERAYLAAGITVPFSVVAGVLTRGGAEGAITRALTGGAAARAGVTDVLKAGLREGGQEAIEEAGQITGEAVGTQELPTPLSAGKQLAVAGTLGAVMGGGVNVAEQAGLLGGERPAGQQPDGLPAPAGPQVDPTRGGGAAAAAGGIRMPGLPPAAPADPVAANSRLAQVQAEDVRLRERLAELNNPANGYGQMFDSERADLFSRRMSLMVEADSLNRALQDMAKAGSILPTSAPDPAAPPPGQAPDDLQNRDRTRAASVAQMQQIATNPDYLRLGPSRSPDTGAPMVFAVGDDTSSVDPAALGQQDVAVMADGQRVPFQYAVVDASTLQPSNFVDGAPNPSFASQQPGVIKALNNGRTAGLRGAYERGTAGTYLNGLLADAAQHGVSPEAIKATPNPVLVRLYSEQSNTRGMAERSQGQGLGMTPAELARQDAPLMDAGVLAMWRGGDPTDRDNLDFVRGFVGKLNTSGQDIAGLMTAQGALSPAGRSRIQAAMAQAAYGDADLIAEMFDSTDSDIKSIGEALKTAAGSWANMRDSASTGAIDASNDITPALLGAVNLVRRARQERKSLYDLSRQTDITTGQTPDPMVLGALRLFYGGEFMTRPLGRDKVAGLLEEYTRLAAGATQDGGLFGDAPAPSDVLAAITKEVTQDGQQGIQPQQQPAGGGQPNGGGNPGRAAGAPGAAGQRPVGAQGGAPAAPGGAGQLANAGAAGQAAGPAGVTPATNPAPAAPAPSAAATQQGAANGLRQEGQGGQEASTGQGAAGQGAANAVTPAGAAGTPAASAPAADLFPEAIAEVRAELEAAEKAIANARARRLREQQDKTIADDAGWRDSPFADRIRAMYRILSEAGQPARGMLGAIAAGINMDAKVGRLTEEAVSFREGVARRELANIASGGKRPEATWQPMTADELRADRVIATLPRELSDAAAARINELGPALAKFGFQAHTEVDGRAPQEAQDIATRMRNIVGSLLTLAPARYLAAKGDTRAKPGKLERMEDFATSMLGVDTRAFPGVDTAQRITPSGMAPAPAPKSPMAKQDRLDMGDPVDQLRATVRRYASGLSRISDLKAGGRAAGGLDLRGVGVDVGELSKPAIEALADAVLRARAALFIDSGAFSAFRRGLKSGVDGMVTLDFDAILQRYDDILEAISDANPEELSPGSEYPQPLLVMPDIVGDQAGSIELVAKYRDWMKAQAASQTALMIIPIQVGKLSMADAYREIVKNLGSDNFIVGVPSNERAVSPEEFTAFLSEIKPRAVHILGAASDAKLNPRLSQIVASGMADQIEVTADASPIRSAILNAVEQGAQRGQAISDFLYDENDPAVKRDQQLGQKSPAPAVSPNTIFTEDAAAAARARLKSKLGRLQSGIDPETLMDGITLAGYHIEKGARNFAAYARAMVNDLGDEVKPYLVSWYLAVRNDPRAAGFKAEMDRAAEVEDIDVDAVLKAEAPVAAPTPASAPAATPAAAPSLNGPAGRMAIARNVADELVGGKGFDTIIQARKFISDLTGEAIEAGTQAAKLADETIEMAVVMAARDIVRAGRRQGWDDDIIYQRLVGLYERQPNLGVRSSTSVREQAYSTPVPLAFLASRLAQIKPGEKVGEPTAGNTMLLLEVDPKDAVVNELNPDRAANARALGFTVSTNNAATQPLAPEKTLDAEVMNPPFGAVKDDKGETIIWSVGPNYGTREIDHAIAFKALDALKDDGRAVLIVGGVDASSEEQIRDGYRGKSKREFYFRLYNQYNVVDHFTVDGDLYSKQGAGYPVDVIVIKGRGKATRTMPAAELPVRYDSWDGLKERLNADYGVVPAGDRPGADGRAAAQGRGDGEPVVGGPVGPRDLLGDAAGATPAVGPVGSTRTGNDVPGGSQPGGRGSGAAQPGTQNRPDAGRDAQQGSLPGQGAGGVGDGAGGDRGRGPGNVGQSGAGSPEPRQPGLSDRRGQEQETATQVSYEPRSGAPSVGTLVPVAMRDAVQESLARVQEVVGDLDAYVAGKLGYDARDLGNYFSAEQVDALALAISNAERDAGFIIGDQTGIGKGRVVAAMIRYALRNNKTPIFITEKPNLYADMIRDLDDIGMAGELELESNTPRILMTNTSEPIPYTLLRKSGSETVELDFKLRPAGSGRDLETMLDSMATEGLGRYRVVFTTYSQIQTQGGKQPARMRFISALAEGGYVIFDESHNAGGTQETQARTKAAREAAKQGETKQGRAAFARALVRKSAGSFFSSATYAKRPDVMDLYSSTNMMLAVQRPADLAPAIKTGGVPMQQIVATMLTEDGQYIRRERTFAGVKYETRPMAVDKATAENMASAMRMVLAFSRAKEAAVKAMQKEKDKEGAVLGVVGEKTQVEGANFGAIMHNLIDQMLLALKAKDSVEFAIERLKAGEKVVLTVSNTMGSFLKDYADEMGIRTGEAVALSFRDLYLRYLEKQRWVKIKRPAGPPEMYRLTDDDLGPKLVQMFSGVQEFINQAGFGSAPISPIDYMHDALRKAGFKTDEITGRSITVNYAGSVPVLASRTATIRQRLKAIRGFNSGEIDALILNQSGSTGLSLHASSKVKDQRKRRMIIVQAEKNIDTHMQMLGRVHRTGQVIMPDYTQAMADIPAEMRPAAVLLKKMASLNANTTASRKSAVTAEGVVDFMNDYGGQVAVEFLMDNPDIHAAIGGTKVVSFPESVEEATEDEIRKLTGYIPILPIEQQEAIYRDLTQRYNDLVERENAMGTNKLEARALDLGAKTISSEQLTPRKEGQGAARSRFAEPAFMERVDVARTVKPMTKAEVMEAVKQSLNGRSPAQVRNELKATLAQRMDAFVQAAMQKREAEGADPMRVQMEQDTYRLHRNQIDTLLDQFSIGDAVTILDSQQAATFGVITNIATTGMTKNPAAGSAWKVTVALANGDARSLTLAASQIGRAVTMRREAGAVQAADPTTGETKAMPIVEMFDLYGSGTVRREKRWMVTGNLLAGFAVYPGQIISYTDDSGRVRQGVLMRRGFDYEKAKANSKTTLALTSPDLVAEFFMQTSMNAKLGTPDGVLRITKRFSDFLLEVTASKREGGQYFLDRGLTDAIGTDLYKSGPVMRASLTMDGVRAAAAHLLQVRSDVLLIPQTDPDVARKVLGLPPPATGKGSPGVGPVAREEAAVYRIAEPGSNYDLPNDLFPETQQDLQPTEGQPVPATRRGGGARRPVGSAAGAGDVQPTAVLSLRPAPALPGLYHYSSQIVAVGQRELPVERVTNWQEAASAMAAMGRYAVEHFDVLITDAAGKPLAVVGAFKGAIAQASVYPSTMLAEALRIQGAAQAWGVHNHPSGIESLSRADLHLSQAIARTFDASSVKWMGVAAIGDGKWQASDNGYDTDDGDLIQGGKTTLVPVVERTITRMNRGMVMMDSPAKAKAVALQASNGASGIVFADSQHRVTAWVPVDPAEMGELRVDGRFDRLINSAAEAGAGSAVIVNQSGAMPRVAIQNIVNALHLLDVRTLDVLDVSGKTAKSAAETGLMPSPNGVVFSRGAGAPRGMQVQQVQQVAAAIASRWAAPPEVVVVQSLQDERVPEGARREDARQRKGGATGSPRGFFLGGRVYLVADGLSSITDAAEALFHEALGHYGLRAVFGQDLGGILDQLALARPDLMRPKAAEYGKVLTLEQARAAVNVRRAQQGEGPLSGAALESAAAALLRLDRRQVAEEVLAGLAETKPELGFVKRAVAAIRTWLRQNVPGFENLRLTDAEIIRSYILPARGFVERGEAAGVFAADVAAALSRKSAQANRQIDPEFAAWFGQSKAVDAEGRPLMLFRGSASKDESVAFAVDKGQAHFTTKPSVAEGYTSPGRMWRSAPTGSVFSAYLSMQNPLVLDANGKRNNNIPVPWQEWKPTVFGRLPKNAVSVEDAAAYAKALGYDGLIVRNVLDTAFVDETVKSDVYAVFRADQIRSARSSRPQGQDDGAMFSRAGERSDVNTMSAEQMREEIQTLLPRVQKAYEDGNDVLAERLDARLETLMDRLENSYDELEEDVLVDVYQGFNRAALMQQGQEGDAEADLVRDLANVWRDMQDQDRGQYIGWTDAERAAQLRGMIEDYAWRHGGMKANVSDGKILAAARDAFESVYGVRMRQLGRIKTAAQKAAQAAPAQQREQAEAPMFSRAPTPQAQETPEQRAERIIQTPAGAARPLDKLALGVTRGLGIERATRSTYRLMGGILNRLTPETVKAGVISDYGVPESVLDQRALLQGRQRVQLRKAGALLEKLATLTREESRVAYEWMNMDGSDPSAYISMMQGLPEESVQVLQEVQQMIDALSREAVRQGQLDPRSYERLKFAYLRRTYQKYLSELTPTERAARQRTIRILGDQYRTRGLLEPVDMAKMQAADPDWWGIRRREGRGDVGLVNQKFIRLERRKNAGEGTAPLPGMEGRPEGRVMDVAYWPADKAIPPRYFGWKRDEVFEVRDVKGGKVILYRDWTKDERERMGEIDEARFAIARTLQRMIHDVEVGRYLEWLAQNEALADGDAVTGGIVPASEGWHRAFKPGEWVKVPDTKIEGTNVAKYGKLANLYLPGPVWNEVRQRVNGTFRPLGETYDTILRAWKTSKTALSPAVHTNNVMANVVMADWHDVGTTHVLKALRIILGAHGRNGEGLLGNAANVAALAGIPDRAAAAEILNRYRDSGGDIGSWATNEIAREQLEPLLAAVQKELNVGGIDTPGGHIGVMAALQHLLHLRFPAAWDAFKQSKPAKLVGREGQTMIDLYQAEDDVFRLAAWLRSKEQGLTDLEAGNAARRSFLDYDINAPWIEAMRRTGWPFIAFTYRAVPMLANIMGNKPHKILKLMALAGAATGLASALMGGGDDEDRKLLPEEKAGKVWGMVPKLIRMPWNDANGSPVYLDIRRWIPVGDVVDTGQVQAALPIPPGLMPGGPLVIVGEVLWNKSTFTGKELVKETDTAAQSAGKVIDHLYKAFAPNLLGLPGTYATTGVVEAAQGKTDTFGREQSVAQAVASAFGVKLGSYPRDVLEYNQTMRTNARIREIQAEIRSLGRRLETKRITQAEYDKAVEVERQKIEREQRALEERLVTQ
jgi:hypothetical protein